MDISDPRLEIKFPKIKDVGYKITSNESKKYNCISWTIGRDDIWIWPDPRFFWPVNIKRDEDLASFIDFYQLFGYSISENEELETDFEKITIYINPDTERVIHAAKQIESGKWTSKLGPYKDIEHTLDSLTGQDYGIVAIIMKRKIR